MESAPFNKKKSPNRWFTITYQSSNFLNSEVHTLVKQNIINRLQDNLPISDVYSPLDGNIIFSIKTSDAPATFDKIVGFVKEVLSRYTPPLHFTLALVDRNAHTHVNYMYIEGK